MTSPLPGSVPLSFSWKLLKPHMLVVIKDVIFPVMCFSDADQSMWEDDPYEFVRAKYGTEWEEGEAGDDARTAYREEGT